MNCAIHAPEFPQPKTIKVNGTVIARAAIAREVQHHPAPKPILAWQAAARALVVRELLLQEARRLGIAATPQTDDAGRRETDEEALIRAVCEHAVTTPEPDAATCRRYYEQHRRAFRSAAIYEVSHILIAARRDDPRAYAEARALAGAIIAQLEQDPTRFDELARQYSACPSAAHGGNLGQISSGQTTPEFEQALTSLAPGKMSTAPVETRYGFHVTRLDRKIEGRELPFEAVSDRIADYLRDSVTRRASAQYIARLVSRAEITGITLEGAEAHRVN
jgi:peptidyl-prolyl cis-trans isomerase C